jgi:3',5'-cyclic AMP phosphodiesterase CpdA
MRILHLSDTHLARTATVGRESLRRMLADCREVPAIDVVVVTGDVADDGSREAYAEVKELIGAFADERGIPALYAPGNHDERDAFAEVLGTAVFGVRMVGGYRVVTLDSVVPGKAYGWIGEDQLDWLRDLLSEPAPQGSVIAFHHPPIAADIEFQRALGLQNPQALAEVIQGTDVRIILCGHFHLQLFGMLAGVPVWVTPGVVSRIDLTAPRGTERAVRGASASVVDLGGPASPMMHVLHARDPQVGQTAHELDSGQLSEVIAKLGPDAVSVG